MNIILEAKDLLLEDEIVSQDIPSDYTVEKFEAAFPGDDEMSLTNLTGESSQWNAIYKKAGIATSSNQEEYVALRIVFPKSNGQGNFVGYLRFQEKGSNGAISTQNTRDGKGKKLIKGNVDLDPNSIVVVDNQNDASLLNTNAGQGAAKALRSMLSKGQVTINGKTVNIDFKKRKINIDPVSIGKVAAGVKNYQAMVAGFFFTALVNGRLDRSSTIDKDAISKVKEGYSFASKVAARRSNTPLYGNILWNYLKALVTEENAIKVSSNSMAVVAELLDEGAIDPKKLVNKNGQGGLTFIANLCHFNQSFVNLRPKDAYSIAKLYNRCLNLERNKLNENFATKLSAAESNGTLDSGALSDNIGAKLGKGIILTASGDKGDMNAFIDSPTDETLASTACLTSMNDFASIHDLSVRPEGDANFLYEKIVGESADDSEETSIYAFIGASKNDVRPDNYILGEKIDSEYDIAFKFHSVKLKKGDQLIIRYKRLDSKPVSVDRDFEKLPIVKLSGKQSTDSNILKFVVIDNDGNFTIKENCQVDITCAFNEKKKSLVFQKIGFGKPTAAPESEDDESVESDKTKAADTQASNDDASKDQDNNTQEVSPNLIREMQANGFLEEIDPMTRGGRDEGDMIGNVTVNRGEIIVNGEGKYQAVTKKDIGNGSGKDWKVKKGSKMYRVKPEVLQKLNSLGYSVMPGKFNGRLNPFTDQQK